MRKLLSGIGILFTTLALQTGAGLANEDSSAFGCSGIEDSTVLRSIEGKDGFFFRILADLRMLHPFTDQTAEKLAILSRYLEEQGTTLIYVPVPTKSMSMPDWLPERTALYGYDKNIAEDAYNIIVNRLRDRSVKTTDLVPAFREIASDTPPFFQADFHWTSAGARAAAKLVADIIKSTEGYEDLDKVNSETVSLGEVPQFSGMRLTLQAQCEDSLPEVITTGYETTTLEFESEDADLDLFGDDTSNLVSLIGTSFSDSDVNNFAGFIQEYSGLPVYNYAITGGNQFGAIISYLTSEEFQEARPRFIVWENPIYNNLSQYGDGPWTEILASAKNDCSINLPFEFSDDRKTLVANVNGLEIGDEFSILADAKREGARKVGFTLSDGEFQRSRTITRQDRLRATGRFFIKTTSLGNYDWNSLTVNFDKPVSASAEIRLCAI